MKTTNSIQDSSDPERLWQAVQPMPKHLSGGCEAGEADEFVRILHCLEPTSAVDESMYCDEAVDLACIFWDKAPLMPV